MCRNTHEMTAPLLDDDAEAGAGSLRLDWERVTAHVGAAPPSWLSSLVLMGQRATSDLDKTNQLQCMRLRSVKYEMIISRKSKTATEVDPIKAAFQGTVVWGMNR